MGLDTLVVDAEQLIVKHLDLWTSAQTVKSTAGRGSNNKIELTGIKKLRELILELAVRGKLVPQDPSDEPASELLKRIAEVKSTSAKSPISKKAIDFTSAQETDCSKELPLNWGRATLSDIALINPRNQAEDDLDVSFVPMALISTSFNGEHSFEERKWRDIKQGFTHFADGDIGIAKITPCFENSKASIFRGLKNGIGAGTTELHVARPYTSLVSPYFILLNLKSPKFLKIGESKMTGTAGQKRLPKDFFSDFVLMIPPLKEQDRIVAKFAELMALCDQLEQQSYQSIDAHNQLVDTLLKTLVDSANADELASNWQRLSEHFDTLFTTEYSIDALKQTILQLAVMGKLVKQDPTDEPASELLKRIAKEKEALIKAGKIKKQKTLPPTTDAEKPFELPKGWEWCRLPDLGELSRGKSKHRPRNDPRLFKDGIYPLVQTGDVARAEKLITSYASTYNDFGLAQSRLWPIGTLCITIAANIADTGILGIEACFPDSVVGYLPYSQNMPVEYFDYFIKVTKDDLERFAPSTAQKNINLEILGDLLVPCPPEDEIRRIVSKVEDLFNLCDNAKSKILESNNTQAVLAEALVAQIV